MLNWILCTNNDLKIFHRKQVNDSPNMKLVTSLMYFECLPCGIFEGLSHHQEYETIATTNFAVSVGLVYRINNVVS